MYPKISRTYHLFTICFILPIIFGLITGCASKKTTPKPLPPESVIIQPIPNSENTSISKKSDKNNKPPKIEETSHQKASCHQSAAIAEKDEQYRQAYDQYLECCHMGELKSCIAAGQIKLEIFNNAKTAKKLFEMACNGNNGFGCLHLYELEKINKNNTSADIYRKKECELGISQVCINHFSQGQKYSNNLQYNKAIRSFNEHLQKFPNHEEALVARGKAYNQTGSYYKAYQDFTKAISLNPKIGDYYAARAYYHISNKDYQTAKKDYSKALSLQKSNEYYRMRAMMYLYLSDFKASVLDSSAAIHLDPNDLQAYIIRGSAHMHLSLYKEAVDDFNHVLVLDHKHVFALSNRGVAYQLLDQLELAKADFKAALTFDDRKAITILNYLELKILTKDHQDTAAFIKRAYLTARNNEEKLLTILMDMILKAIQNQRIEKELQNYKHHIKSKILLQTNFDQLESFLRELKPQSNNIQTILEIIQNLKQPKLNLFYQ